MDAANWSAWLPLIIAFGLGALGLWLAIRIEVDKTIAEIRIAIREFRTELKADIQRLDQKLDAMSVRVSEYELERARHEGMMRILGNQAHTHESASAPAADA